MSTNRSRDFCDVMTQIGHTEIVLYYIIFANKKRNVYRFRLKLDKGEAIIDYIRDDMDSPISDYQTFSSIDLVARFIDESRETRWKS